MATIESDNPKVASSLSALKAKYIEAFQVHVLNPLRDDLVRMQARLRSELSLAESEESEDREIVVAGLEHEVLRIERVLRVLEMELERMKTLRLSDYDVTVGGAAESSGLSVQ